MRGQRRLGWVSASSSTSPWSGRWCLEKEDVPKSPLHDAIIELLMLVLKHGAALEGRSALVCSNPRVPMVP